MLCRSTGTSSLGIKKDQHYFKPGPLITHAIYWLSCMIQDKVTKKFVDISRPKKNLDNFDTKLECLVYVYMMYFKYE